ncbi:hypothetical protein T4B_6990 [Trichinella pseudospiralis]|uniref:Uncharacterized protein n=1 Tax=Trichinella pseudospiralis TaxID=6337 RepID=A0A0V1GJB5_TRIPS|nr:hypothetical protein T4B_6990 [Trichinella pseudospiralis]
MEIFRLMKGKVSQLIRMQNFQEMNYYKRKTNLPAAPTNQINQI